MAIIKRNKDRILRAVLLALGLGAAIFLASTIETGRVHAQTAWAFLRGLSGVITPNGDGRNDVAIFCFDNPKSSDVSGQVFDLRGHRVASMAYLQNAANCPGGFNVEKLTWDGRAEGSAVSGGIYIYQIQSEGQTVTGTVMVVR